MSLHRKRARFLGGIVAFVLCWTVAAPPAAAVEPSPARPLAAAAAAAGEALTPTAVAQAPKTAPAAPLATTPGIAEGKPFFKTTKGILALALTGGALGYMAYSFSNDRVKSPAK